MVRRRLVSCLVLALAALEARAATRPDAEQAKIDWLLSEIRDSKGTFIRNGAEYNGEKAVSHLKSKLFFAGKRVQTARDFIVGVASHSEASGKPYEIRLPDGKQLPIGDWLLAHLAVYEKGAKARMTPSSSPAAKAPSSETTPDKRGTRRPREG